MIMLPKNIAIVMGLVIGVLSTADADEQKPADTTAASGNGVLSLSPPLRHALGEEMRGIEAAMVELVPHIIAGEREQVRRLAEKIEGSYLLKQQLSAEQRQELHHNLPPEFLTLDGDFHLLAGMLAHVAEAGHLELVNFYYYKLTEACVACHQRYARHRFPELGARAGTHPHQH